MYVCVLHCLFSRATTQVFVVIGPIANSKGRGGFPGGSDSKESACNARDPDSIPGLGRSPGEGMATHSSILAWRIPWTEEPGGYSPWSCKKSDTT